MEVTGIWFGWAPSSTRTSLDLGFKLVPASPAENTHSLCLESPSTPTTAMATMIYYV